MEEDEHQLIPRDDPTTTTATALQGKHAAMLERLSNLHQSRQSQKPDSNIDPSSTQSFLSTFSNTKLAIESNLTRIHHILDPHSNRTLKSDLENISNSISQLETLVSESSYFLPSYEIRTCLNTISQLKQTLGQVSADVIPRKKFSFKSKLKPSKSPLNSSVASGTETLNEATRSNSISKIYDSPGFKQRQNEVLVQEFGRDGDGGEFILSDLEGCEVRLMGCLRVLFVHRLKVCKVYVGAVFGSVLIEEVEDCVFMLASHQIRIHHAKRCDFYVRVRSRPIIEDCIGVRFAPYCLRYDGIQKDLEEANLGEETGNWGNVDDFRWLRAVQSPNWSVLPESERIETLCISNSDG